MDGRVEGSIPYQEKKIKVSFALLGTATPFTNDEEGKEGRTCRDIMEPAARRRVGSG